MRQYHLFKYSLAVVVAFVIGIIVRVPLQKREPCSFPVSDEINRPYPIWIKGLTASKFDGDKILSQVRAEEFKVNPRRYFVFNIRPFNEATFTNVRLETHYYPDLTEKTKELGLFPPAEHMIPIKVAKVPLKGEGIITRGVVTGFIWEIFKADRLCLVVKAKAAQIDFKEKEIKLINVSIEDESSQKLIMSRSAIWSEKEKSFRIPGKYLAATPKGKAVGKGIKLDLNFVASPLS